MTLLPRARMLALWLALGAWHLSSSRGDAQGSPAPVVNVKDFGAMGDCRRVSDGTMNQGSTILLSAAAHFTKADIGREVCVLQAGAQKMGELGEVFGAPLSSRIVSVMDASTVTLADAARQDVSRAEVCWGTDDSKAIQQAIDSLAGTGGTVYFPPGLYRVTYQGGPGVHVGVSNIRLHGSGPGSGIFNSTVLFHAKMKEGRLLTEQGGVPALYAGVPGKPVENVEVDHLWLGDNGQDYRYRDWGPHGWGVLGCAGRIDCVHFHDLTIETKFLCGVNMDSETNGFTIDHVTVRSSGEHGFYLAGTGTDGDVHDNRILGTTSPMRQGMAIKKKRGLRITHNEVTNVDFQGICVVGDSADQRSYQVLIADNWLHDLGNWHTEGIVVSNAEDVVIADNRIEETSWVGISLRTTRCEIGKVVVRNNTIARAGQMNPCYGISVHYDPPPQHPAGEPWPGKISGIVVENNRIVDCPNGIQLTKVEGENAVRGNRVERALPGEAGVAYQIQPAPGAEAKFTENTSVNYAQ